MKTLNPPAFPRSGFATAHDVPYEDYFQNDSQQGMTLRDYFAAKVLPVIYTQSIGKELGAEYMANCAYILADAMLEARAKA